MLRTRKLRGPRLAFGALFTAAVAVGGYSWLTAADHEDSPSVIDDQPIDIADVYSFRSPTKPNNIVLAMTLSDAVPPAEIRRGRSVFDPEVLYQFKIDNNGDAVEDLVIQAFVEDKRPNEPGTRQRMHFVGPVPPDVTGTDARSLFDDVRGRDRNKVDVSTTGEVEIEERHDMMFFAGVRDDPFFFDLGQFLRILAGEAGSFNDPGTDSFAGLNVYAIVVELPLDLLGGDPSSISVWGTTSRL